MKKERKRTPAQWAVLLLIWCGPTLLLWLLTIPDALRAPEWPTGLALFLLAQIGLIVTRLIFLFRSSRSVGAKIWRAVVWIIVMALIGLLCLLLLPSVHYRCTSEDAQNKFETAAAKHGYGSEIVSLELGAPQSVKLYTYNWAWLIFSSESSTLLCRYGEEDYPEAKAALETRYSFRTEPMGNGFDPEIFLPPYVSIGDDSFRVVQPEDGKGYMDEGDFYKHCFLIVTNDAEHEIGYVVFFDYDLDMAEDLTTFLQDECGWRLIRKSA